MNDYSTVCMTNGAKGTPNHWNGTAIWPGSFTDADEEFSGFLTHTALYEQRVAQVRMVSLIERSGKPDSRLYPDYLAVP